MHKKILILGNGFDLDLGLKSRYRDFMFSSTWKEKKRPASILSCNLLKYLEEKNEIEAWFDAESELLNYALKITQGTYWSLQKTDRDGHEFFQAMLKKYLLKEQEEFIPNNDSIAAKLMEAVIQNGFFDEIFTFNYTDLNKTLAKFRLNTRINTTYMHGSLEDSDNIILGIETDEAIHKDYQFLFKTNSRFYRYNSLIESMESADEIIFFGHSINGMDFPYFKEFFIKQSKSTAELKRKYITIFTYDDSSDQQIRNNFREAGVNLRDLMQRNNMTFIETKYLREREKFELKKWNDLLIHLKDDSKDTQNNNLRRLSSMLT